MGPGSEAGTTGMRINATDDLSTRRPGVRRDDEEIQLRFALACDAPNSFLISLMPSESRGHSQENESLAHCVAFARARKSLAAACCFTGLSRGTGTFSVSLLKAACCTCCCFAANAAAMVERRSWSR